MTKEERRLYTREYRATLRYLNLCIDCRKKDAYTLNDHALCYECLEKRREAQRIRNQREEVKKQEQEAYHKRHESRIANHECVKCGKSLETGSSYKMCYSCRLKQRAYLNARRENAFTKGQDGRCWRCNKRQAKEGKRLCPTCYEQAVKKGAENLQKVDREMHPWRKLNLKRG